MNIAEAIGLAADALKTSGVPENRREAASLLCFVLRKDGAFLIAHPEYELTRDESSEFERVVNRRRAREPLQYITGRQEFFGLDFRVTPDVLIPRPETEILVEAAVEILSGGNASTICEIGIGSGCISVSILHSCPAATGIGVDVSPAGLEIARSNADKHRVIERLSLRRSDLFEAVEETAFDLVVSNPPYVPDCDLATLQGEVRDHEPLVALSGGADGLAIIRRIVEGSPRHLKPGGTMLMEIGFDQAARVRELFSEDSWGSVDLLPDLAGIPRIVKARLKP